MQLKKRYFPPQSSAAVGPLDFSDVSMRIFLLRANIAQLERFCDAYLNMDIPQEMAHFRPSGPFVMLQVLNYGKMSPVASNLGWVAQHEILFGIPLEGHWHENGRLVEGSASVSPFIFVDNDWSVVTGREVYGWPKYPAQLVPEVSPWMSDPRKPRRLLKLQTQMFPELYSGEPLRQLVLLEVLQEAPQFGQLPVNVEYLMNPLSRFPKSVADMTSLVPDMYRGFAPGLESAPEAARRVLEQMFATLQSGMPQTSFNTINLKQFRSSQPDSAAYQSLVNGRMSVRRFNASGLLGSLEQLRGDPTGGFSILVHRYPDFPIVESLGLVVDSQLSGRDVPVDILKPLAPGWVSLDLRYDHGTRLCWRTQTRSWAVGSESGTEPAESGSGEPARAPFNSALGPVVEAIEGPFDFLGTSARILPLKARWDASEGMSSLLQDRLVGPVKKAILQLVGEVLKAANRSPGRVEGLAEAAGVSTDQSDQSGGLKLPKLPEGQEMAALAESLNEMLDIEFKMLPWVFVVIKRLGKTSAHANNLGWWGGRSADLVAVLKMVVRQKNEEPSEDDPYTYFLVTPYAFADTPMAVNAGREVLGLPTSFAAISPGSDPWIDSSKPEVTRNLLNVTVRDYPALGVGQGAELRSLIDVERVADEPTRRPDSPNNNPTDNPVSQLAERWYEAGVRIPNLTLKQFRDEEQPHLICYRAVMAQEQILGSWASTDSEAGLDVHPMRGRYHVRFHNLPSWPLVESMGLEVDHWEVSERGSAIAICDVVHPCFVKADLRWNLPVALTEQSVDGQWRDTPQGISYLSWRVGSWFLESAVHQLAKKLDIPDDVIPLVKEFAHQLLRETDLVKEIRLPIANAIDPAGQKDAPLLSLDRVVEDLMRLDKETEAREKEKQKAEPVAELPQASIAPREGSANGVTIRDKPAVDGKTLGRLKPGQTLPRINSSGGWHEVRLDDGGKGFVAASWSRVIED